MLGFSAFQSERKRESQDDYSSSLYPLLSIVVVVGVVVVVVVVVGSGGVAKLCKVPHNRRISGFFIQLDDEHHAAVHCSIKSPLPLKLH